MEVMEVLGKHGTYTVDIEKVTCSCPDFKFRKFKFAKMSEERRCIHLKEAMINIPTKESKTWSEKKRHLRSHVEPIAKKLAILLSSFQNIEKFEFCGSFRRGKETIGDLDILILKKNDDWSDNKFILKTIEKIAEKVMVSGEQKTSLMISDVQVDIRFVKKYNFVFQVAHATGSKDENVRLRAIAKRKGMALSEYGLFDTKDKESIKQISGINSEEDIYKALGIPYVKPENR